MCATCCAYAARALPQDFRRNPRSQAKYWPGMAPTACPSAAEACSPWRVGLLRFSTWAGPQRSGHAGLRSQQETATRRHATVPSVPLRGNHRRAAMGNRWRRVRTLRDRRENGGDVGEYRARRHGGAPVVSQLGLRAPGGGQGGTRASAARGAHEQACAASPG